LASTAPRKPDDGETMKIFALFATLSVASATTYFSENFDAGWEDRWVSSTKWKKESEMGKWVNTAGKYYADESDKGLQTGDDARFYGISAKMAEVFDNKDKDLVVQFSVKHEQDIDCGGAYIKLLPADIDQDSFGGDTEYGIMFGPDICGYTKRTHLIFNYKGKNLLKKDEIKCESDTAAHLYTLIVKPDNTYSVKIDGTETSSGSLADGWDFLEPKEIKDPAQSKPKDWVDERRIPDPEDKKPEGWDDIPEQIPDPEAEMPEDWDPEDDGEWEPPMIDNPEYKGVWKAKMIDNPAYKGEWEHPMIPNPDFVDDDQLYNVCKNCGAVGFELWQVKSGTVFDDILVTDDIAEAAAFEAAFKTKVEGAKAMEDEAKKKEEEERKAKEEAEKAKKEAEKDDDEDDEDLEATLEEDKEEL